MCYDHININVVSVTHRCPFLLDLLVTAMTSPCMKPKKQILGPLVCIYSMIIHQRNGNLSAFQRLITLLGVKGNVSNEVGELVYVIGKIM